MSSDRFYFRQLLSGRDFATDAPVAQQMVNFVYAIGDRATSECVLIDPAYAVHELLDIVEADGMKVTGVLATHFHPDHIGGSLGGHYVEGVATLLERCECPVHVQRDETPWVTRTSGLTVDQLVQHEGGDVVQVGDIAITLVHTPGHTPGSVCFEIAAPGERTRVFAGDTLFRRSVGRTDLPGGDAGQLRQSIKDKLYTRDLDALVIPGHGPTTTLGDEARANPFVRAA